MDSASAAAFVSALAPLCKEHGIRRVKVGDFEMELGASEKASAVEVAAFAKAFDGSMPSDEDMLFASAPGGPPPKGQR